LKNLPASLSQQRKQNNTSSADSETHYPKEVIVYKTISIILCVVFVLLFFVNLSLDLQLNSKKASLDKVVSRVESYSDLENSYNRVGNSVALYKTLRENKVSMSDRALSVYSSIPEGITVNSLCLAPDVFQMYLTGHNVLVFSTLIDKYAKNPMISSISLDSATLLVEDQDYYQVALRGVFK